MPDPEDDSDDEVIDSITDIQKEFLLSQEEYNSKAKGDWKNVIAYKSIVKHFRQPVGRITKYKAGITNLRKKLDEISKVCHSHLGQMSNL